MRASRLIALGISVALTGSLAACSSSTDGGTTDTERVDIFPLLLMTDAETGNLVTVVGHISVILL